MGKKEQSSLVKGTNNMLKFLSAFIMYFALRGSAFTVEMPHP